MSLFWAGHLDLPSGVSGDMLLGCLVDAGWPVEQLVAAVQALHLPAGSWSVHAERVTRGPVAATLVQVSATEGPVHRHLREIEALLAAAELPPPVKQRAGAVFARLAAAEAKVHGVGIEEIHFHEVGAIDAIIDVVGVCAGLDGLGVVALSAGALPLGSGWGSSAHGRLPLPAPATLELLAAAGAPVCPAPGPGELVTPTGAALVCTLAEFGQPPMVLQRVGSGAGQKEFGWPNVARLWLGKKLDPSVENLPQLVKLETNIDDMNPELYGPLTQRLLDAGAADVWLTPVYMKKGRPGVQVTLLASPALEETLARMLLAETTTLGVRVSGARRHEAERSQTTVATPYGSVRVKLKWVDGELCGAKPEFTDCLRLAEEQGLPLRRVEAAAAAAAQQLLQA